MIKKSASTIFKVFFFFKHHNSLIVLVCCDLGIIFVHVIQTSEGGGGLVRYHYKLCICNDSSEYGLRDLLRAKEVISVVLLPPRFSSRNFISVQFIFRSIQRASTCAVYLKFFVLIVKPSNEWIHLNGSGIQ